MASGSITVPRITNWLYLCLLLLLGSGCASVNQPQEDVGRRYVPLEVPASEVDNGVKVIDAPEGIPDVEPTVVSYLDYNDPFIGFNRAMFTFNDTVYRYALIPLANGYVKAVPLPVRNSVTNFFYNLKTPIYLVNNVLQLEGRLACRNLARFVINSTLGLAGLFDPADAWFGLQRAEAHFDDTLMKYGAGYGVYLVLPFFGPSDLRDGMSAITDYFLNPITYLMENPEKYGVKTFDFLQDYASDAERYEALREKSDDPYILFRNLYLQSVMRDADYQGAADEQ
ncbi:MlaA family lipoprotein [Gilvimarinus algae]|uniref:VacJ family lipoprotein n=1 Tax=Gilvimarinus algae TaxID=3058037 RepID=A0ABT8TA05_9GAMM|nr:VacJ family lipoprotein [Gilvimarinus sp. SDUM040014]MDO3380781.1 VacJ family lipoprotein [Gilvimarinus sp. SDUM040014]